jgi:hypothetical protein
VLLAHRALDEHVEVGNERERLGHMNGIAAGERAVPHRPHGVPGHLPLVSLVAVIGLGHDDVGPAG